MKNLKTKLMIPILAACSILAVSPALADTIHLKDGSVLDGEISREGDSFIMLTTSIGDIENVQLISKDKISRIERDEKSAIDPADDEPIKDAEEEAYIPEGATRIAFLRLGWLPEDTVGPYINKDALERSVDALEGKADVLVLWINTGGGSVAETVKLVDYIEKDIKPKFRLVGWVNRAISGGSFTMHPMEEIYFMPETSYGGSVAFGNGPGGAKALEGADLERMLEFGELASKYGHHEPLLMRAMQIRINLSYDIDEDGVAHFQENREGQYILNTDDRILTLNSKQAMHIGFAKGVASTKEELVEKMGYKEWVEVGQEVDDEQQRFRDNMKKAEIELLKASRSFQNAMNNGNIARAKKFLGDMRSWSKRAPAWQDHSTAGLPPLNREFFRELERQVDELRRAQQKQRRSQR